MGEDVESESMNGVDIRIEVNWIWPREVKGRRE